MSNTNRTVLFDVGVTMVTETCCDCGILFGVDARHRQWWLDHPGQRFYCPNGHGQYYTGKTEAQKARERAEAAERRIANLTDDLRVERLSHRATKGRVTKLRNRAAAGLCPCCKRHFNVLERHIATQHPEFQRTPPQPDVSEHTP